MPTYHCLAHIEDLPDGQLDRVRWLINESRLEGWAPAELLPTTLPGETKPETLIRLLVPAEDRWLASLEAFSAVWTSLGAYDAERKTLGFSSCRDCFPRLLTVNLVDAPSEPLPT